MGSISQCNQKHTMNKNSFVQCAARSERFGMVTRRAEPCKFGFSRGGIFHNAISSSSSSRASSTAPFELQRSRSRPCRSRARCIARSDGLDPIEPLQATVESYPEMGGIDVTVVLALALAPFLSIPLSLYLCFASFISFDAKR